MAMHTSPVSTFVVGALQFGRPSGVVWTIATFDRLRRVTNNAPGSDWLTEQESCRR